jgi:hypothetical protein
VWPLAWMYCVGAARGVDILDGGLGGCWVGRVEECCER